MSDLLNAFSNFLAYLGDDISLRELRTINPEIPVRDETLSPSEIKALLPSVLRSINHHDEDIQTKIGELVALADTLPEQRDELVEHINQLQDEEVFRGGRRHYKKRRTVRRKKAGRVHRKNTHARRH